MIGSIRSHTGHIVIASLALLCLFIFSSLFTYFYFSSDLKSKDRIVNHNNTGLILLDRQNQPFFSFYSGRYNSYTPLSEISLFARQAVIASEDKNFYSHPGFSWSGIARSVVVNMREKNLVSGGSTITQQLVKNSILTPQRNFLRKYQELILAQEIERRYSKDEILEMYLNSVYFGNGAFGIEQAAEFYFGKAAKDLSLQESALLAGILPSPAQYSSESEVSRKLAKKRQEYVLSSMERLGYITAKQKNAAQEQLLVYSKKVNEINTLAPHFALMVKDTLVTQYGEEVLMRSGFKVRTTLDPQLQKFAEKTVAHRVAALANNNVSNGAAVVLDPATGEIKVMVGSSDWYNSEYGRVNVSESKRQPGSSFKPVVYALAFTKRLITPATMLSDTPTVFANNYKPRDYDGRYRGNVTVRRALANSLNIPSVQIMQRLGVTSVLSFAHDLGITSLGKPSQYGLSLVLGAGEVTLTELTNVYATFANNGVYNQPTAILSIEDKYGDIMFVHKSKPRSVIEPGVTFLISSILSDRRARSEVFGSALDISRGAAVKTGTTENYKDAWTIGYTPQIAVGVWVGNNDNTPMDQIAGSLGAAPIWKDLMEEALKTEPELAFVQPEDVVQRSACLYGNASASALLSRRGEYFMVGTQPSGIRCERLARISSPGKMTTQYILPELPQLNEEYIRKEIEQLSL